jgi:hypothetical protein
MTGITGGKEFTAQLVAPVARWTEAGLTTADKLVSRSTLVNSVRRTAATQTAGRVALSEGVMAALLNQNDFLYSDDGDSRAAQGHPVGVHHAENLRCDLFLVTLNKDPGNFSPAVMYKDYAISSNLFHWESQNSVASDSATASRYVNHLINDHELVLCIRQNPEGALGTAPFQLIGSTELQSHAGSKPLQLTLMVKRELPSYIVGVSPANAAM